MLTTACATGVGVDMYISDMALNPPHYNRMLKWFNSNCKWCWEVQYNDFFCFFLQWDDCKHICHRPAAVFDAAVCWRLSDHLIDDAAYAPPFTGTLPYGSQPGCSSKQEKNKFLHKDIFIFRNCLAVIGLICVSSLIILQSESITGAHPEQSSLFYQHPEMCSRATLQNFKCFAPLRKHFTIIRQFHLQFFADLAFWIYQTYTKSVCSVFKYPVNPSTHNVEGVKGFQQACLTIQEPISQTEAQGWTF